MTLKEFLDNPAGKGDSSMNRAALIKLMDSKYEALVKSKKIKVRTYRTFSIRKNWEYYIHLTIPTETERDNTYDVVFHLYNPGTDVKDVKNYEVKFFSNTPSFAYTFAYVYFKNGLFEDSLQNKFDPIFFKEKPVQKNQYGVVNYDKYLYFGAKYVIDSRLLARGVLDLRSVNYVEPVFNSKIRTFDTIMNQYNKAKNKLKKKSKTGKTDNTEKKDIRTTKPGTRTIEPVEPKQPKTRKPTKPSKRVIVKKVAKR